MKLAHLIGAIAAMLATCLSTATMWTFSALSLANASAESVHRVKIWVLSFTSISFVGLSLAAWLLYRRRPGKAAISALTPSFIMGAIFIYKLNF